ncbi:hypothetical protein CRG98_013460 [Punica granatum]|uniref:Uncharacterized protein n=1 Tax=Punica granatum TaxID=22663 RepID=A0A2I0KC69_PUNGR|nr:hypothetical protein CRG98_013460 [Punica granatum]
MFASDRRVMNSNLGFNRRFSCGKPVGQNGVLTNVFRGAPPTSLTDVIRLRRPSPHHGTRRHVHFRRHRPPQPSLYHRQHSCLRNRPRPHLHLSPYRPQPRSILSLRRWSFRGRAHPLRLILKQQSFPPTRLYNLTPTFPTNHCCP